MHIKMMYHITHIYLRMCSIIKWQIHQCKTTITFAPTYYDKHLLHIFISARKKKLVVVKVWFPNR